MIPDTVEKAPISLQLFKGTMYSNSAKVKRLITSPGHTTMATTGINMNKRHRENPANISKLKTPKKLMEEFAKTCQVP